MEVGYELSPLRGKKKYEYSLDSTPKELNSKGEGKRRGVERLEGYGIAPADRVGGSGRSDLLYTKYLDLYSLSREKTRSQGKEGGNQARARFAMLDGCKR